MTTPLIDHERLAQLRADPDHAFAAGLLAQTEDRVWPYVNVQPDLLPAIADEIREHQALADAYLELDGELKDPAGQLRNARAEDQRALTRAAKDPAALDELDEQHHVRATRKRLAAAAVRHRPAAHALNEHRLHVLDEAALADTEDRERLDKLIAEANQLREALARAAATVNRHVAGLATLRGWLDDPSKGLNEVNLLDLSAVERAVEALG